jgi:GNAT superfamily N-acetyltransferase
MTNIDVRATRVGDAAGVAAAWIDAGQYYAGIYPDLFQIPTGEVVSHFQEVLTTPPGTNQCRLVGVINDEVVGYLTATLHDATAHPEQHLDRARARPSVWVDSLMVRDSARRHGVGRALMAAIEEWAEGRGADVVELDTFARSPISVPFYESLGYERRAIVFRKSLRPGP